MKYSQDEKEQVVKLPALPGQEQQALMGDPDL